jgi:hypothetical protein
MSRAGYSLIVGIFFKIPLSSDCSLYWPFVVSFGCVQKSKLLLGNIARASPSQLASRVTSGSMGSLPLGLNFIPGMKNARDSRRYPG